MSLTLVVVTYRLRIPADSFRQHAKQAAPALARSPGLVWKIWGLDAPTGAGTSVYLFASAAAADTFLKGPAIAALRNGPAENITIRMAPADRELSTLTGAALALRGLAGPEARPAT